MKAVNRSALLVAAKPPFYEWARSLGVQDDLEDDSLDPTIYLIDTFDDEDELTELLSQSYDEIFQLELSVWEEDDSLWPEDRSFDTFLDWFDVIPSRLALDIAEGALEREDLD